MRRSHQPALSLITHRTSPRRVFIHPLDHTCHCSCHQPTSLLDHQNTCMQSRSEPNPPASKTATARTLCSCAESVVFCVCVCPPPSLALDHFFSPVSLGNCAADDSNVFRTSPQASADQALFRYVFSRDFLDVVGAEAC